MPTLRTVLAGACLALLAPFALADEPPPTSDIPGAADSPLLKRYEGSFIVSYQQHAFDELRIPLSPLKAVAGQSDKHNNRLFAPERQVTVEGAFTRLVYLLPENRSPLEVLRNYQEEIQALGGRIEFECKAEECGGDPHRATSGGGGNMSLAQYFLYEANVKDKNFSNGHCALTSRIDNQRFLAARVPQDAGDVWISVHTYQLVTGNYCKPIAGRTVALVHVSEPKAREQKMVLVKAEQMASSLDSDGSISLYGIYFDADQAQIKPESDPTLQEIAKLLSSQPGMAVLVVGHTDSQGSYQHNLTLSARRAEAVKAALQSRYGIDGQRMTAAGAGMMAPVASNATEEGRAKNRRVTLVKAN